MAYSRLLAQDSFPKTKHFQPRDGGLVNRPSLCICTGHSLNDSNATCTADHKGLGNHFESSGSSNLPMPPSPLQGPCYSGQFAKLLQCIIREDTDKHLASSTSSSGGTVVCSIASVCINAAWGLQSYRCPLFRRLPYTTTISYLLRCSEAALHG